ncbi:MAG: diguanylate cyclase [Acetatifactor sp.]
MSNQFDGRLTFQAGLPVSALLMDLDFFKKVNDRYGHEAGDTVLIHLAKTIKTQVRATDYVIRDEAMYKAKSNGRNRVVKAG